MHSTCSLSCSSDSVFADKEKDIRDNTFDEMATYYDERAPEYELLYQGKGPLNLDARLYRTETVSLCKIVGKFGRGHLIDIGCGTCFWLPLYAKRCRHITLVDGSSCMLQECRKKVNVLHLSKKCRMVHGDFFSVKLPPHSFSSALIAFFLSHVRPEQEREFFSRLQHILRPNASVLLVDSVWNRKREVHSKKQGFQQRRLTDGRTHTIYKRYFDEEDIECLKRTYRIQLETAYCGDVFFAARGEFHG